MENNMTTNEIMKMVSDEMTYNDYKANYGEITSDGKTYALTQDAYPTGGSFDAGIGRYDGNWYEAHAEDTEGNEYMIRWTRVDWDAEDGGDACDWDNPDYISVLY